MKRLSSWSSMFRAALLLLLLSPPTASATATATATKTETAESPPSFSAATRSLLEDSSPPTVDIRVPVDGETVSDHSYVVAARVRDDGGSDVSTVQFQFKVPPYGVKTDYLDANVPSDPPDVYYLPLPLHLGPDGPWEWRVKAVDSEGNKEVTSWSDFVVGAEPRLPDDLELTVDVEGEEGTVEMRLTRRSVRTDDYELKLWSDNKGYEVTTSKEVRTYRGTAVGHPNTILVGSVFPDGTASINGFEGKSYKWRLEHIDVRSQLPSHAVFEEMLDEYASDSDGYGEDLDGDEEEETYRRTRDRRGLSSSSVGRTQFANSTAGEEDARRGRDRRRLSSTGSVQPPSAHFPPVGGMKEVELAFDITHYYLNDEWGGSRDRAVAELEYLANVYDHFMARDVMIASVVTQAVIRTEQFYFPTGMCGSQLRLIANEWRGDALGDTRWDLVNSVFATEAQRAGSAGCAYGNKIPSVSIKALYHETGHNWGASHKTYARDTMDGNRPHHGPCNVEKLLWRRGLKVDDGTLADHGDANSPYPDPLHPYAHVDIGTTLVNEPLVIPVLANDWDGNGDDIYIGTFTPSTANAGTVTVTEVNSDSGGQQQQQQALRYAPPPGYVGKDMIYYEVVDSTGLSTQELVHIEVINEGLAVEYDFESDNIPFPGDVVLDATGRDHPGKYTGESVGGVVGRGVRLDDALIVDHRDLLPAGVSATDREDDYPLDDFQAIGNSFDPMDESYTLAFWFRVDTTGLVQVARKDYQRDGQKYGYHIDVSSKRLTFNMKEFTGLRDAIQFTSDQIVERHVWYHCALVFDRSAGVDRVMLYLDGGKLYQSDLLPGSFIFMGRGPLRFGEGAMGDLSLDEVQVHTRALSVSQVGDLVEQGDKPTRFGEFLEAEDAVSYGGGVFLSECGGDYSGTGYFDYEDDGESAFLEWEVDAPKAGEYELTFEYSQKSENRKLRIRVNGAVADDAKGFPVTGAWCKFDATDLTVSLASGTNTIRAEARGMNGPVIDRLSIKDVPTPYDGPPRFISDVIEGLRACPGKEISASVAPFAFDWDPNDAPLTFEKRSGPGWMSVNADGSLSGSPKNRHIGLNDFRVRVKDPSGLTDDADLEVDVQPPIAEDIIDFSMYNIRTYDGDQDVTGAASVEDCGATFSLTGNLYKSIALDPPYEVTPDTVLEFDFRSGAEGNVHAIGLDEDDVGNKGLFFKLYGTRDKNSFISDFENYANGAAPYEKHYAIPVGRYYTGTKTRLFFVNDHDSASEDPTAESVYSNVKIYESDFPFTPQPTPTPTPGPEPSPTREPTSSPTSSPTSVPTSAPTPSSASIVDLTAFATYVSTEQFFTLNSSAYFVTTDPDVGPTERVWWGGSRTTVNIALASTCLPPGETVVASVNAQQTACGKTWQMNAGRRRDECGHSLVLTLDGAAANPWLDYYNLRGCDFHGVDGPHTFVAYLWHDDDADNETPIGSPLSLDFALTVETDLPFLADLGDCSKADPCGVCQGDCDNDDHCEYGLVCDQRDGTSEVPGCAGAGVHNTDHCVVPPPETLVKMGNDGIPASAFPLGKCQGDCDKDSHCAPGLLCFLRCGTEAVPGCGGTGANGADYCYDPNDAP